MAAVAARRDRRRRPDRRRHGSLRAAAAARRPRVLGRLGRAGVPPDPAERDRRRAVHACSPACSSLLLDAIASAVLGAAGPEHGETLLWALELGLRVPYLAAALALFAATDAGRVRMVVERRRSALFAFTAGARFAWRHRGTVVLLYAALFATAGLPWALISAAESWLEPGAVLARLLDAVQVGAAITAALVSAAAATSLFQAALAHASYVAPPRLVWPDSPGHRDLGRTERRLPAA